MQMNDTRKISIIPAQPGWFVLYPIMDEDDTVIGREKMAIIAWAIQHMDTVPRYENNYKVWQMPITVEGSIDKWGDDGNIWIQEPSGVVRNFIGERVA